MSRDGVTGHVQVFLATLTQTSPGEEMKHKNVALFTSHNTKNTKRYVHLCFCGAEDIKLPERWLRGNEK